MSTGFSVAETPGGGYLGVFQPSSIFSSNPLFIRAYVNHLHTIAILDTGSSTTLIHSKFLNTISYHTFRPLKKSYSSANCSAIEIIGEVELNIEINGLSTMVVAAIASNLVTDILLGVDWISRYVVSIHLRQRTVIIQNKSGRYATAYLAAPPEHPSSPVTVVHQVTLLPFSDSAVDVHVRHGRSSSLLFEPSFLTAQPSLHASPSLLRIENN